VGLREALTEVKPWRPRSPRLRSMVRLTDLLERDRKWSSLSVGQVAWRLGLSPAEYRELEAGARSPSFEVWDEICRQFGWPPTFIPYRSYG